jgi:hypothetical protein
MELQSEASSLDVRAVMKEPAVKKKPTSGPKKASGKAAVLGSKRVDPSRA